MKTRARTLMSAGLLMAGFTAMAAAPGPGPLQMLGAQTLAAQRGTSVGNVRRQEEAAFLEARRAINAEEFARAAELMQEFRASLSIYASGSFVPDSYYWEAFARYRLGDLAEARLLLETLMIGFPEAQEGNGMDREIGRLYHDARALEFEIRSRLASSGDAGDAEALLREVEETLDFSSVPGFRVMPMEVAGETVSLPVAIEDLARHADTLTSGEHARADSLLAEAHARAESLQSPPDSLGQAAVEPVAPVVPVGRVDARNLAEFQQQLADYRVQVADYQEEAAQYEWQLAEYQEAARAAAQEQEACEDASVQLAALEALMRFEINRVQELEKVLRRMDECSRQLHERAVLLVGREETRQAERVLLEVIRTYPSDDIRRDAIDELRRFNSWEVFRRLRQLVGRSNDPDTQERAIYALRQSSYGAQGVDSTAIRTVLVSAAARESNETEVREAAIDALARRTEAKGEHLIQLYASLGSDDLKVSLLNALERKVRFNDDEESAAWAYALAFGQEESSNVRAEAFGAWSVAPSVTVAYLSDLYGNLSEPFLKRQTIYAIYQRAESSPDASAALMDIIRVEPDQEVRERGIYWLGRTGSEAAVEFLLEVLGASPPDTASRRPDGPF